VSGGLLGAVVDQAGGAGDMAQRGCIIEVVGVVEVVGVIEVMGIIEIVGVVEIVGVIEVVGSGGH